MKLFAFATFALTTIVMITPADAAISRPTAMLKLNGDACSTTGARCMIASPRQNFSDMIAQPTPTADEFAPITRDLRLTRNSFGTGPGGIRTALLNSPATQPAFFNMAEFEEEVLLAERPSPIARVVEAPLPAAAPIMLLGMAAMGLYARRRKA